MRKLELSIPSERLIGFTIPTAGSFYVCDHDEVWKIEIGQSSQVELTDFEPYPFSERPDFVGWGDASKKALIKVGSCEIDYEFDGTQDYVTVTSSASGRSEKIQFRTLSGDWFCASLSDDGRHLVLADPYAIELYETT